MARTGGDDLDENDDDDARGTNENERVCGAIGVLVLCVGRVGRIWRAGGVVEERVFFGSFSRRAVFV